MGEFAAVARDMEAELVEVSHSAARDSGMEQLRIIRWSLELDRLCKRSGAERWRTNYLNDVRPWLSCTVTLHRERRGCKGFSNSIVKINLCH